MTVVIMCQPRFAPLVESGTKTQTIRKERKRPIKVGDMLSLRAWEGVPRRSKQRVLREALCLDVHPVTITEQGIGCVQPEGLIYWARADGFLDWQDMRNWFRMTHGLPFTGVLIRWNA